MGGKQSSIRKREEKGRQRSRARDKKKKQRRHFLVGRTTRKFCSSGDKMRNASDHQCKVRMSGSEKKVNENTYDISSKKRVTNKFLEVSCCSHAKKVCCMCKVAFSLIRPIVVFHCSLALPSLLSITRFYILFEQTLDIIESFAFSPG